MSTVTSTHAMLTLDYKQNLEIWIEHKESQTTYYNKAVCVVHGAVLHVGKETRYIISWSIKKKKTAALLATIVNQFMRENKELIASVEDLHIWADNATQYHCGDIVAHLAEHFSRTYGMRVDFNFGPAGENKEEVDAYVVAASSRSDLSGRPCSLISRDVARHHGFRDGKRWRGDAHVEKQVAHTEIPASRLLLPRTQCMKAQ